MISPRIVNTDLGEGIVSALPQICLSIIKCKADNYYDIGRHIILL